MLMQQLSSFRLKMSSTSRSNNGHGDDIAQDAVLSCIIDLIQLVKRWRTHLLIDLFKGMSEIMRQNRTPPTITPLFLFKISTSILGVIIGGNAVFLIQMLNNKIKTFSPTLYYILMAIIILIGPDLFFIPPITPLNGCTMLKRRLQIGVACLIIQPTYRVIYVISGFWHMDRGDFHHRKSQNYAQDALNDIQELRNVEHINHRREEEIIMNSAMISLTYCRFRVMFGVGMAWAGSEIYSSTAFLWAMVFFIVTQVIFVVFESQLNGLELS